MFLQWHQSSHALLRQPEVQGGDVKDDQAVAAATIEADTKVSSSSNQTQTKQGEPTESQDGGQDQKSQEIQLDVEIKELNDESTHAMSDEHKTTETLDHMTEIQAESHEIETNTGDGDSDGHEHADELPCQVNDPIDHGTLALGTEPPVPEPSKPNAESQFQKKPCNRF